MPKEINFNEAELLSSMQHAVEHAQGVRNLKTTKMAKKAAKLSPTRILKIRQALKASTPVFAAYLNVSPDTVRSWERKRKRPSGPALKLLELAEHHPELFVGSA